MNTNELLLDSFGRVAEELPNALQGLDADQITWRPGPQANPIGWLAWHLARVEDAQMADLARRLGDEQAQEVWLQGWSERFALPYPDDAHGYGMSSEQVAQFHLDDPTLLVGYYAEVHQASRRIIAQLTDSQLGQVIDTSWTPEVTAGVRLVSTVNDITQHLGQIGYLRGLLPA